MAVVLVTGASKGIGLATAEHLAKSGYTVYSGYRTLNDDLKKLASNISNLRLIELDVTSQESVDIAIAHIKEKVTHIDVLINNAGFGIYGPTELHTIDEVKSIFEANFFAVIRMNQAVIPIMRDQKRGKIINISSVSGLFPSSNLPIYSASKAALEYLSAVDKAELSKWNIDVFLVHPGPVITKFEESTPVGSRKLSSDLYSDVPARREKWKNIMVNGQTAMEIAEVIRRIICSDNVPFWNPTSDAVREKMKAHYVDVSGKVRIPAKL